MNGKFEQRHYIAIASVLAASRPHYPSQARSFWEVLVQRFEKTFSSDNEKFDPVRFNKACYK